MVPLRCSPELSPSPRHVPIVRMRRTCALVLLWLAGTCTSALAEPPASGPLSAIGQPEVRDLRAGVQYREGTRVRSPFVGVSFVVPKDWRASLPAGSVIFIDSAVTPGLGTIHLLTEITREALLAQLNEPQSIEAGFVLHPVGSIQQEDLKFIGLYAAGDDVGVTVALLGPSRNAVIYQFVGRKTERDIYQRLAVGLAASTQFMNEQDSPVLRAWYERLTGMMLSPQLDSRVAQSVGSTAIHLCSDGRFIRTIRLQSVPGRVAKGEEGGAYHETGTWLIDMQGGKVTLILTKSTGGVDQHDLQQESDQVLLDGQVASVNVSSSCL
jgi:hypothetical protein